jgi:hypothetical protein
MDKATSILTTTAMALPSEDSVASPPARSAIWPGFSWVSGFFAFSKERSSHEYSGPSSRKRRFPAFAVALAVHL